MKDSGDKPTNHLVPNSFQFPNFFIDEIMYLLTADEWRVFSFMVRHIMGWRESIASRQHHISLSVFTDGFGQYHGCGLSSRGAVINQLESLEKFGLAKKVGKPTKEGQLWQLPFHSDDIDIEALRQRKAQEKASNTQRINKAKTSSGQSDSPVSPTNQQRSVPLTSSGQSDSPNKPTLKPTLKENAAKAATPRAANPMFDAFKAHLGFTEGGLIGRAIKELKAGCPDCTPEDIPLFVAWYQRTQIDRTGKPLALPGWDKLPKWISDFKRQSNGNGAIPHGWTWGHAAYKLLCPDMPYDVIMALHVEDIKGELESAWRNPSRRGVLAQYHDKLADKFGAYHD